MCVCGCGRGCGFVGVCVRASERACVCVCVSVCVSTHTCVRATDSVHSCAEVMIVSILSCVGTMQYMAPEVIQAGQRGYGPAVSESVFGCPHSEWSILFSFIYWF